ncbi:MAG: BsuPI-related putative proteinase inhibitor [Ignavibacteriota bacterium]
MRRLHTLLLLSAFLPALPAAQKNLFPLAAGNQWEYQAPGADQTLTIAVQIPVMHNDHAYFKVTGYAAQPAFLRQAENGNIFSWDDELEREYLVTSFEIVPGGWFDTGIGGCPQGGQTQDGVVRYQPVGLPELTAVQVNYRSYACADTGILEEQYAENIGLLRRVVSTIAGPRTYELVHAKVSGVTYDTRAGNGFQVSLSKNYLECGVSGNDNVTVEMRLSRKLAPSMELIFPSAQRYDIRVRSDAGQVVYRWSDDQAVAQVQSSVIVDRDLVFSQKIPLSTSGGQPLTGGYYTVEASLATTNHEFAGATRFFYSPCEPERRMRRR